MKFRERIGYEGLLNELLDNIQRTRNKCNK